MKSQIRKLRNRKGVFGLTSVQAFFAIVLAVALLAYVVVVIMGTLNTSSILPYSSTSTTTHTAYINSTGYNLTTSDAGFSSITITSINGTGTGTIPSTNYTITNNLIYNGTKTVYENATIKYSYNYYSPSQLNSLGISNNVSSGVALFFTNINPVYTILAILVIILVLVVLVRVVTGGSVGGGREGSGQVL